MWKRSFIIILFYTSICSSQTLFGGVLNALREGMEHHNLEPEDQQILFNTYDFIIVGAGTAGCTLANRLTENENWRVLLIEAGRPENFIMDYPLLANYLQFTEANWKYKTMPSNSSCLGMYII